MNFLSTCVSLDRICQSRRVASFPLANVVYGALSHSVGGGTRITHTSSNNQFKFWVRDAAIADSSAAARGHSAIRSVSKLKVRRVYPLQLDNFFCAASRFVYVFWTFLALRNRLV